MNDEKKMQTTQTVTESEVPKIINVDKLSKTFGKLKAVDGVSFYVKEGEIFGFLGPNGAGKSTTINMLTTLLTPARETRSLRITISGSTRMKSEGT